MVMRIINPTINIPKAHMGWILKRTATVCAWSKVVKLPTWFQYSVNIFYNTHCFPNRNVFKKIMGLKHSPSAAKAAASGATKQTKSLADLLTEYSNGTAKNDDDLAGQAKNIFDAFNNVNEGGE